MIAIEHLSPAALGDAGSLTYREPLETWTGGAALLQSIARHGVLTPIVARSTEDGLQLVSGFRRLAAARQLGLSEVPLRRVVGPLDELFLVTVAEHAGQTCSLRERCRAVTILAGCGWDDETLAAAGQRRDGAGADPLLEDLAVERVGRGVGPRCRLPGEAL